jgi:hypothetical protein
MAQNNEEQPGAEQQSFESQVDQPQPGLVREFWAFLANNKKWWLTPIIVVLLLFGLLIILGGTAFAPFIYPFF